MSNNNDTHGDKGDHACSSDTDNQNTDASTGNDASNTDKESTKQGHQIPKHRFDAEVNKRKAAESLLDQTAETLLAGVPESFKALIPEGDAEARIKWYNKANESGAFNVTTHVPATDSTSPKVAPQNDDHSELNSFQKIEMGLNKGK